MRSLGTFDRAQAELQSPQVRRLPRRRRDLDSDDLPASAKQKRETFARFGLAIYQAQCVERQLGILLATVYNEHMLHTLPDDRDRFFEAEFSKTLGQLVSALRLRSLAPDGLEGRLTEALRLRNWLAHDYYWERAHDILTWAGRERMIDELQEAADYLAALDKELTATTEGWLHAHGVSREEMQAEYERIAQTID